MSQIKFYRFDETFWREIDLPSPVILSRISTILVLEAGTYFGDLFGAALGAFLFFLGPLWFTGLLLGRPPGSSSLRSLAEDWSERWLWAVKKYFICLLLAKSSAQSNANCLYSEISPFPFKIHCFSRNPDSGAHKFRRNLQTANELLLLFFHPAQINSRLFQSK